MAPTIEQVVRTAFEESFAGRRSVLVDLLADDYVQYGPDLQGVYQEFRAAEYGKMFSKAAALTDSTYEILETSSVGDEIVFMVVRSNRRAKASGVTGEYRVALLINILDGRITRIVEIGEQAAFEFWRKAAP